MPRNARNPPRRDRASALALYQNNEKIAYYMVNLFAADHGSTLRRHQVEKEDLEQEACLTLYRAAEQFDETRGWKFSTYACKAIYLRLHDYLERLCRQSHYRPARLDGHEPLIEHEVYDGPSTAEVLTILDHLDDQESWVLWESLVKKKPAWRIALDLGTNRSQIQTIKKEALDWARKQSAAGKQIPSAS